MSTSPQVAAEARPARPVPPIEILLVMLLSLGLSLASPSLKTLALLLPIVYLIAEHYLRHHAWVESGFNLHTISSGLVRNLGWVLLVGVGTQALAVLGAYYFLPAYSQHVLDRLPFDVSMLSVGLFISLAFSTLGEEIIFRGLFQNRLAAFLPPAAAIGLVSLVFALMHFSAGPALIVGVDLASIFIDSLIYGIIYQRTQNVFVSWIAHFLADLVGLAFILLIK